jgi:membrane protein implicated in regulation of membrane protease activity
MKVVKQFLNKHKSIIRVIKIYLIIAAKIFFFLEVLKRLGGFWFWIILGAYIIIFPIITTTFFVFPMVKNNIVLMYYKLNMFVPISLDYKKHKWYVRPITALAIIWYRWTNKLWEDKAEKKKQKEADKQNV